MGIVSTIRAAVLARGGEAAGAFALALCALAAFFSLGVGLDLKRIADAQRQLQDAAENAALAYALDDDAAAAYARFYADSRDWPGGARVALTFLENGEAAAQADGVVETRFARVFSPDGVRVHARAVASAQKPQATPCPSVRRWARGCPSGELRAASLSR